MERIHTQDDPIFMGYLKTLLIAEGIACTVRNELLIGGSGELPPNECWPELWVLHAVDAERARTIVNEALTNPPGDGESWECTRCGEKCESQFTACWQCGSLPR